MKLDLSAQRLQSDRPYNSSEQCSPSETTAKTQFSNLVLVLLQASAAQREIYPMKRLNKPRDLLIVGREDRVMQYHR